MSATAERKPLSKRWFALKVQSQKEHRAKLALQQMGYGAKVPHREKWRKANHYTDRRETKFPLMYGMLFVGIADEPMTREEMLDNLRRAQRPHFVYKYLGINGWPFEISEEWLVALEQGPEAVAKLHQRRMRTHGEYDIGQIARIVEGPFAGFEGMVENINADMAYMVLSIFGRQTPVQIPVDQAVKAA